MPVRVKVTRRCSLLISLALLSGSAYAEVPLRNEAEETPLVTAPDTRIASEAKEPLLKETNKEVVQEAKKPLTKDGGKPIVKEGRRPIAKESNKPIVKEGRRPIVKEARVAPSGSTPITPDTPVAVTAAGVAASPTLTTKPTTVVTASPAPLATTTTVAGAAPSNLTSGQPTAITTATEAPTYAKGGEPLTERQLALGRENFEKVRRAAGPVDLTKLAGGAEKDAGLVAEELEKGSLKLVDKEVPGVKGTTVAEIDRLIQFENGKTVVVEVKTGDAPHDALKKAQGVKQLAVTGADAHIVYAPAKTAKDEVVYTASVRTLREAGYNVATTPEQLTELLSRARAGEALSKPTTYFTQAEILDREKKSNNAVKDRLATARTAEEQRALLTALRSEGVTATRDVSLVTAAETGGRAGRLVGKAALVGAVAIEGGVDLYTHGKPQSVAETVSLVLAAPTKVVTGVVPGGSALTEKLTDSLTGSSYYARDGNYRVLERAKEDALFYRDVAVLAVPTVSALELGRRTATDLYQNGVPASLAEAQQRIVRSAGDMYVKDNRVTQSAVALGSVLKKLLF